MAREVKTDQDYKTKLLKLIPSEIVAAYIMIAFIIWIYTLGEPFRHWGIWQEWIGSALLILYTLTIPLFYYPRAEAAW